MENRVDPRDLKPIKVLFNNLDYGYYYLEPFFDKYLVELNNFRDSEIFEIYPDSIQLNHLPKEIEFSEFVNLPKEIRIGAIVRGKQVIIPGGNFIFEKDDLVVLLSSRDQLKEIENIFSIV